MDDQQAIKMVLEYLQQESSKGREKPSAVKGAAKGATKGATKKACYRCGRPGHYSPDCYARTHQKGYALDSGDSDSDESYDSDD